MTIAARRAAVAVACWSAASLRNFRVQPDSFGRVFLSFLHAQFITNLLIFALIVTAIYSVDCYLRYREREGRALALEGRLAKARLEVLRL